MTMECTRMREIVRSDLGMVSRCFMGHPYGDGHPAMVRERQYWGNHMGSICTQVTIQGLVWVSSVERVEKWRRFNPQHNPE